MSQGLEQKAYSAQMKNHTKPYLALEARHGLQLQTGRACSLLTAAAQQPRQQLLLRILQQLRSPPPATNTKEPRLCSFCIYLLYTPDGPVDPTDGKL